MKISFGKPSVAVAETKAVSKPSSDEDVDAEIAELEARLGRRKKKPKTELVGVRDSKWKMKVKEAFQETHHVYELEESDIRLDLVSKINEQYRISIICAGDNEFFTCLCWKEKAIRTIEMDYIPTVDITRAIAATIAAFNDLNLPF